MNKISNFDFKVTLDGDLLLENKIVQDILTDEKDITLITDDNLRAQIALNRIKSVKTDWFHDNVGADIEEVLGMPATEETDNLLCNKIIEALTYDNYFNRNDIYIELNNKDVKIINYNVYIKDLSGKSAYLISVDIDLTQDINVNLR